MSDLGKYEQIFDKLFPYFESERDFVLAVALWSLILGEKSDMKTVVNIVKRVEDGVKLLSDYYNVISQVIFGEMDAKRVSKGNRRSR